ncbi:DUF1566 domain-containing protein [Ectothiorhodospiraceae bacterium BW-2]|nr:DUF1566 domain-containing protein [Ectothiorhodospiraceae bacterium BW-2]
MRLNSALWLAAIAIATLPVSLQAQICEVTIPRLAPDSRYIDHGNGTVTDSVTGLMWKQCSEGQSGSGCSSGSAEIFTWDAALQRPATLNSSGGFAGYGDWRLPNRHELYSLVEVACASPSINLTYFPNTSSGIFWSSSVVADLNGNAWFVDFNIGRSNYNYSRTSTDFVRLVRGGTF